MSYVVAGLAGIFGVASLTIAGTVLKPLAGERKSRKNARIALNWVGAGLLLTGAGFAIVKAMKNHKERIAQERVFRGGEFKPSFSDLS